MAKKKQENRAFRSERTAALGGAISGFGLKVQGKTLIMPSAKVLRKPIRIPSGKFGAAALAIGGTLGIVSIVQAFTDTKTFTDTALKVLVTNPISATLGRLAGNRAGALSFLGVRKLKIVSSRFAANKAARNRRGFTPNKGKIIFRRIRGRIVPIGRRKV